MMIWPPGTFFRVIIRPETKFTAFPDLIFGPINEFAKDPENLVIFCGSMDAILAGHGSGKPEGIIFERLRRMKNTFEIPTYWSRIGVFRELNLRVLRMLSHRLWELRCKWIFGNYKRILIPVDPILKIFVGKQVGIDVREYITQKVEYYCQDIEDDKVEY